nr:hypothetical protein [Paenibacillus hamazuiensis]
MELMQRYLDKDLEDKEHLTLAQHVRQCSECTELFSRLKRLSSDLENLPKVTPAFSLVDAILPRLEELDRERFEAQMAMSEEVDGQTDREPEAKVSWLSRLRERVSFKWVGGVVAAGLAIGFFIFHEQSPMYNADQLLSGAEKRADSKAATSAGSTSAGAASRQTAESSAMQNQAAPAPAAKETEESKGKTNERQDTALKATPKASTEPKAPSSDTKQPLGQYNNGQNMLTTPSAKAPMEQELAPPATLSSPSSGNSAKSSAPPAETDKTAAPLAASNVTPTSPSNPPAAKQGAAPASSVPTPAPSPAPSEKRAETPADGSKEGASAASDEHAPMRSFVMKDQNGFASETSSDAGVKTSPDGNYTAKLEDRRVVIRGKDGKVVFSSAKQWKETDQVVLTGWSKDDVLTYQVTSGETVKTYEINAKTQAEAEKTSSK